MFLPSMKSCVFAPPHNTANMMNLLRCCYERFTTLSTFLDVRHQLMCSNLLIFFGWFQVSASHTLDGSLARAECFKQNCCTTSPTLYAKKCVLQCVLMFSVTILSLHLCECLVFGCPLSLTSSPNFVFVCSALVFLVLLIAAPLFEQIVF